MVSVSYDSEAKALYIYLISDEERKEKYEDAKKKNKKGIVAKTLPVGDDRYLDIDENGKAIGLEVLFHKDLPQEAVDAIINNPKQIVVINSTTS